MFAHSRDPHPAIKLWCQVPFTKSKTSFQIEMYCMLCFLKSKYIKSRTFNDKNRLIIKKVMVLKKLLSHLATRSTYSPGDWRCDEAWREQTLVYPPVMCQQRLTYCTWELNAMNWIMDTHNRIMDIHNSIMDIHNWIMDIHYWIMDIHNYRVSALFAFQLYRKVSSFAKSLESSNKKPWK